MARRAKPAATPAKPAKRSHESVHYGRGDRTHHCSICEHYIKPTRDDPKPHCEGVVDPIAPLMWCVRFERRS